MSTAAQPRERLKLRYAGDCKCGHCSLVPDELVERGATELDSLRAALRAAVRIAEEARQEWDMAPSGMRAGKLLIALGGSLRGYRADIDAIHQIIRETAGTP